MGDYLGQLQQQKHIWVQPAFNSLPALFGNHGEKQVSFNPVVGAQKDISLLYNTHSIWKPPTPSSRHADHESDSSSLSSIKSSASLQITDQKWLDQTSRNILITNIPQDYHRLVVHMIIAFGGINDMLEQACRGQVTMVVIFYDLGHAHDVYAALTQFLQTKMELWHVGLDVCDNQLVASTFNISLNRLQDTHVYVVLRGNPWALTMIDYKLLLGSYGTIRYYKQTDISETTVHIVVEYSDTRVAATTQKKLDGMNMKNVVFRAYLFKPEAESTPANWTPLQPISRLSSGIGQDSLLLSSWSPKLQLTGNAFYPFDDTFYPQENMDPSLFSQNHTWSPCATPRRLLSKTIKSPQPCSTTKESIAPDNTSLPNASSTQHVALPKSYSAAITAPALNASTDNDSSETTPRYGNWSTPTISNPSIDPPKYKLMDRRQQRTPSFDQSNTIDWDRILTKQDKRTTFMIRNIPNKYDQAMLMECIDATHKGTYDFIYLRIDFQNRCNVGYAFINFMEATSVLSFAKQRKGKQWNRFNSDKVCELAYANIQGKAALVDKFRNSTVMTHDITYRPKIFYSDGILKGQEEPFPEPDRPLH